ncbi:hypothetical protein [Pseudonocardia sp. NPDC049154]|uniref:hypothetical protein n=1 Tax=Pseudonocardia sp. NPDC049154 TaxID=3155501 RepID=UPI0033D47362
MTTLPFSVQLRHEGAWLTVGGNSADDAYSNLAEVVGQVRADQIWTGFAAEQVVRQQLGATPAAPAAPAAPTPPATPAGPPAPPAAPPAAPAGGQQAPMCSHGPRRHYEGTNARGPYTAWFCAAPKGTPRHQQCQPLDGVTLEPWK